ADLGGVIEQHLIDVGARTMERVGVTLAQRIGELERHRLAGHSVDEPCSVLADEPRIELLGHAKRIEYWERHRQERLAQMKPGERLFLEHAHVEARSREKARYGGASGTSTEDDDVVLRRAHRAILSRRPSAADPAGCARRCTSRSA